MDAASSMAVGKAATLAVVAGTTPFPLPFRVEPQAAPAGALDAEEAVAVEALRELIAAARGEWMSGQQAEADAHMDDFTLHRFCTHECSRVCNFG
jgi:hypothetical protein